MSIKKIQLALVILATIIFALAFLFLNEYWVSLLALGIGVCWWLVEKFRIEHLFNLFFVGFIGLAVRGSMAGLPAPLMLGGLCLNLAAWDLSRFHTRIRRYALENPNPGLVNTHIRRLSISIGIGYILALTPTFTSFPLNFVMVLALALLIIWALRQSIITLRSEKPTKEI